MDPATISAIMSILGPVMQAFSGSQGKQGSTYNKGQLSQLDQIMNDLKGMRGSQDITQNQNYQTGQDWLQSMFSDPEFFNKFEAPMQRQFQEQTVPELANRFAGMGSGGSTGSTAFRNQLAREGSNLHTNIAAMRGSMQQQAIPQMMNYAQQPFQNYMTLMNTAMTPTQNTYQQGSMGA
jgi:hypothetical protein